MPSMDGCPHSHREVRGPMGCIVRRYAVSDELENDSGKASCDICLAKDSAVPTQAEARSERIRKRNQPVRKLFIGDTWECQLKALPIVTARKYVQAAAKFSIAGKAKQEKDMKTPQSKGRRAFELESLDNPNQGCAMADSKGAGQTATQASQHKQDVPSKKRKIIEEGAEPSVFDGLDAASVYDLLAKACKDIPSLYGKAVAAVDQKKSVEKARVQNFDKSWKWCAVSKIYKRRGITQETRAERMQREMGVPEPDTDFMLLKAVIDRVLARVTAASSYSTKRESMLALCNICAKIDSSCGECADGSVGWKVHQRIREQRTFAEALFHVLQVMVPEDVDRITQNEEIVMEVWRKRHGNDQHGFGEVFSVLEAMQIDSVCNVCEGGCDAEYAAFQSEESDSQSHGEVCSDEGCGCQVERKDQTLTDSDTDGSVREYANWYEREAAERNEIGGISEDESEDESGFFPYHK
ncbi:hypothetical protein LTR56_013485 [Elasticomyces elasticus]|nr:hypothetical protein LTR56_013485 [Elasticomyces elasticus]KAK5763923.1 hypothetical protein LTS12_005833 [Elasticomyces elasticus]